MSRFYLYRLRVLREERDAARLALAYRAQNWQRSEVAEFATAPPPATRQRIMTTDANLETTFFVRPTAEFEGILKDHLHANHRNANLPLKVDALRARVLKLENLEIDPNLRTKLNEARDYRNSIAHSGQAVVSVTFDEAFNRYNRFAATLPDPLK